MIWTCRGRIYEQEAIDFLEVNGIHYDFCNNNLPETVVKFGFETRKLSYDVLIDDRNLNGFVGWENVIDCLKKQFPEDKYGFCDQTFYRKYCNGEYIKCGELKLELNNQEELDGLENNVKIF